MKKLKIKNAIFNYINFHKYNKFKNVDISKKNRIYNHIELRIDKESSVIINDGLKTEKNVSIRCRKNSKLTIGKNVFLNNNCIITCRYKIKINDNVIIGPNVVIFDHDHNYKSKNRESNYIYKEINIGKNVWIGANACILKGSNIGDNTVIAAGAVVNCDVPKDCIYYSKDKIKKIGE